MHVNVHSLNILLETAHLLIHTIIQSATCEAGVHCLKSYGCTPAALGNVYIVHRNGEKYYLSDFDCDMLVGARWASLNIFIHDSFYSLLRMLQ